MKKSQLLLWPLAAAGVLCGSVGLAQVSPAPVAAPASPASAPAVRLEPSMVQAHPWQSPPPRLATEAYFTNLVDGAKIETPFRATFGLSAGWGLAPIAQAINGKSGHHHLLVNRELPLDFQQALPFNDQYIHFGKGQMEAVLTFPPGTYKLRLLLADEKHLPKFVYSKPLTVTVTNKRADVDPKSLVKKGISLLNIGSDARFKPPFRVQFHASGLNVAHLAQKQPDSGHFRLTVTPQNGRSVEMLFPNGQTETWLSPPVGVYALKLELMDNVNLGKTLTESVTAMVRVE